MLINSESILENSIASMNDLRVIHEFSVSTAQTTLDTTLAAFQASNATFQAGRAEIESIET